MRVDKFPQIAVIESDTAQEFEAEFNRRAKDLNANKSSVTTMYDNGKFVALIEYECVERTIDTVTDEFHMEGIKYICDECPYMEDPDDKRVMHVDCKYAEFGRTHRKQEACELFYRQIKQGKIKPIRR